MRWNGQGPAQTDRWALAAQRSVEPALEMPTTPPPTFDEAIDQFRAFARNQGAADTLVFVHSEDVVLRGSEVFVRPPPQTRARSLAQEEYVGASNRGLGVKVHGLWRLGSATCVCIAAPSTSREQEELPYPNGLKLSLSSPLRPATLAGGFQWAVLKFREWCGPIREKEWLFK